MLAVWLAVIMSRNVIRSYWWAHKLRTVATPQLRFEYFYRLCSLGDRAVPAVSGLLSSPEVSVRSFAVGTLHHAPGEDAFDFLTRACRDVDDDVARLATQGLALRADSKSVTALADVVEKADQRRGMMAVAALSDIGSDFAIEILVNLLHTSPHAGLRVQVIEGLGKLSAESTIDPLIAALGDNGFYEGSTEGDVGARRAFDAVSAGVTREWAQQVDSQAWTSNRYAVWRCADRALRTITGFTPEYGDPKHVDQKAALDSWLAWQAQRQDPLEVFTP